MAGDLSVDEECIGLSLSALQTGIYISFLYLFFIAQTIIHILYGKSGIRINRDINPIVKIIGIYINGKNNTENIIVNMVCCLFLLNLNVKTNIVVPAKNITTKIIIKNNTAVSIFPPTNSNLYD